MSGIDSFAVTALVVAVIALLTTICQLLQQYLATADGYRRCQASIMGCWAQYTRLRWRWRWREFRFETLYTIPRAQCPHIMTILEQATKSIAMDFTGSGRGIATKRPAMPLVRRDNFYSSKRAAALSLDSFYNCNDELVSWLPLLHWLHETTRASFESVEIPRPNIVSNITPESSLKWRRFPALVMRERSWDSQPPDIT